MSKDVQQQRYELVDRVRTNLRQLRPKSWAVAPIYTQEIVNEAVAFAAGLYGCDETATLFYGLADSLATDRGRSALDELFAEWAADIELLGQLADCEWHCASRFSQKRLARLTRRGLVDRRLIRRWWNVRPRAEVRANRAGRERLRGVKQMGV